MCKNWWLLYDFRRVIFPDPVILNRLAAVLFVFSFGMLLRSSLRLRQKDHDHHLSVKHRRSFHRSQMANHLRKFVQLLAADLGVGHLTCLEHARHLNLVSFFEKPRGVSNQEPDIVLCNERTDLYTLYVLLLFLSVTILLFGLVLVTAVIDDLADRRLGSRRHHHEVQSLLSSDGESLAALEDS